MSNRDHYFFRMIARLKPGVTLERARAEMSTIGSRLEQQYPRTYRGPNGEDGGWQVTVTTLQDEVVGNSRLLLLVLLCVVAFVLAVAAHHRDCEGRKILRPGYRGDAGGVPALFSEQGRGDDARRARHW